MRRTNGLRWLLLILVVLALAACGGTADDGSEEAADATTAAETSKAVGAAPEAKADCGAVKGEAEGARIAYMPPATEFPYYIAIGEGIKAKAAEIGYETFMLAPQSGADIEGQMGMIQDVLTQEVDGIVLSTHDEKAAAPLVKQAVEQNIAVVIVNSDIADFPTPVHGVVGYRQRPGTHKLGEYAIDLVDGKAKVGLIEGQPGYHSTERIGGFVDAIEGEPGMEIVASQPGGWNVEGGNKTATDMLQAHPEITMIMTANDYMSIGANKAAKALGRDDVIILGNDGDTQALEEIYSGDWEATVNTTPFEMGGKVLEVMQGCLGKEFDEFYVETPTQIVDKENALEYLQQPQRLHPKPSKEY
ncbi:MAG: sugar ABC transporter substrate-binding protein [Actinobacteria bacterium]|nr:sugar ABC transporter substrate-binding protein [Actinomycetota bacterium]